MRFMVDAMFVEGMFLALLGSTLSVTSFLGPRARRWRKIGIELVAVALVTILFTITIGEGFVRLR